MLCVSANLGVEPPVLPAEESPRILVADDEKVIRDILADFLTMEGYSVRTVEDGEAALAELTRTSYDLLLSDLKMPNLGGLELLEKIGEAGVQVVTVIMTGFGTVETAIQAMKKGAYDYVLKPFKIEEIVHVVQRGLEKQRLQAENLRLKEAVSIYRLSEALTSTLSLETVLDITMDTIVSQLQPDLLTLHLAIPTQPGSPGNAEPVFEERVRRVGRDLDGHVASGDLDFPSLLAVYREDEPLLVHGSKAARFFKALPPGQKLVSFCSIPLKVQHRIIGTLAAYSFTPGRRFDEGERKMLAVLGSRAAVSLENARLYGNLVTKSDQLATANLSLEANLRQTIEGFAQALEESDRYTRGHSERVSQYARLIAAGLKLDEKKIETVVHSALMHDIGKIGIRNEKLNRPGKLTQEEMAMFRTHPAKGRRILEPIRFLRDLVSGCYCHHEAWDGSGYPQALTKDHIPEIGRIIAVADAYDAMTSDRAYRKALPHRIAIEELVRCTGTQFEPEIVKVFVSEIERYRKLIFESGGNVHA